jgi:hypothetical protein
MARRRPSRRRRTSRSLNGLSGDFMRQSAKVAGTAIVGKLLLWAAAIVVYRYVQGKQDPRATQALDVAQRIAAPPQFLITRFVPAPNVPQRVA